MARLAFWSGLAGVVAVVIGCAPPKELPDEIPAHVEPKYQAPTVPSASEPGAKAYIDKAVATYTGGNHELIKKGKASRLALKGKMLMAEGSQKVMQDATRQVVGVWPDRCHVLNERQQQGQKVLVGVWLDRHHLTIMDGRTEVVPPNRSEYEQSFMTDALGQFWMMMMLPETDPKVIVFDLQAQVKPSQGNQSEAVQTLKLSLNGSPLFHLTFDAKTDALLRVEYTLTELSVPTRKTWVMKDHKRNADGLLLPSQMECQHNGGTVEEWEVQKWEFPEKLPDSEFSPPKK